MTIKSGIYEQLINTLLQHLLEEFSHELFVEKEKADQAELPHILAHYLFKILNSGLACIKGTDKEKKQIQICNKLRIYWCISLFDAKTDYTLVWKLT